jgi:hypothetical protein
MPQRTPGPFRKPGCRSGADGFIVYRHPLLFRPARRWARHSPVLAWDSYSYGGPQK